MFFENVGSYMTFTSIIYIYFFSLRYGKISVEVLKSDIMSLHRGMHCAVIIINFEQWMACDAIDFMLFLCR